MVSGGGGGVEGVCANGFTPITARHSIVCSNMQSVRKPWYADIYPDMHVCGPIYILIPRYMNVQSSVQMHIVGAKYRVRTSPISRA